MKQTNYIKWVKYRELSEKYHNLFLIDCKRELDQYLFNEKQKAILEKLVLTEPKKEAKK